MELKRGQLTSKDMTTLREGDSFRQQLKQTSAPLREASLCHYVKMFWGDEYKEGVRKLKPFGLRVDDKTYTLSWAEIEEMSRAGFFRREKGNPTFYRLRYFDGDRVVLDTDLNQDAEKEIMFRLTVDKQELILDWYQMQRNGRHI